MSASAARLRAPRDSYDNGSMGANHDGLTGIEDLARGARMRHLVGNLRRLEAGPRAEEIAEQIEQTRGGVRRLGVELDGQRGAPDP